VSDLPTPPDTAPRATVVIAAWNAEGTILRAVDAALAQTVPVEVVVVDDASTDGTAARVEERAQDAPNLRLLRQPANAGPAAARNRAIDESGAPWIAVLDSDDTMAPDRLERLIARAEAEGLDFLADDIEKVSEDALDGPRSRLYSDEAIGEIDVDAAAFIRANLPSRRAGQRREMGFLKPVMRRAFLDGHGLRYADLRLGEDYELYTRALILGGRFRLTDPRGYLAVVRPGSLSGKHPTEAHAAVMAADQALMSLPQVDTATRKALREHYLEEHKRWSWRRMIDAGRARDPRAMAACFRAPLPVAADLTRRLGNDMLERLRGEHRSG
jgi:succinoglycan biosynthesis protein ExoU